MAGQALKKFGGGAVDSKMAKLNLAVRPGEGGGALEGSGVVMFVG